MRQKTGLGTATLTIPQLTLSGLQILIGLIQTLDLNFTQGETIMLSERHLAGTGYGHMGLQLCAGHLPVGGLSALRLQKISPGV